MEKLIDLIRQFDTGDIALPIMQRDYVWQPKKVEALLDSLYRKWPIGIFYLWHPGQPQPTIGHHLKGESVQYLLDGQQRLASLSRAIKNAGGETLLSPPGKGQREAISWRGFFDVVNEKFVLKGRKKSVERRIENNNPTLIALSDVMLVNDHISNIEKAVDRLVEGGHIGDTDAEKNEVRKKLHRVASMLDVDVPCQKFDTTKLKTAEYPTEVEAAIEIFRRLNSGGMSLSAGDVEAARLAQEATYSILGPMRDFAKGKECAALGLNFVFLTRALVAIRRGSARFSDLPKSWATATGSPPIQESWRATQKGLNAAIDLVQGMGWTNRRWLPSANALLPVAYFASLNEGHIAKEDVREVERFLCLAAWTEAFSGATETAIDHFLTRLEKAGPGSSATVLTDAIPKAWRWKVKPEDVLNESKTTGTLTQIYLAYLISQDARSWPSDQFLADASKIKMTDGSVGSLEVHHIFPRKFIERVKSDIDVNTMGNYAILTKEDNLAHADRDPEVVRQELTVSQKRNASVQFIPVEDEDALQVDDYEAFINRRAGEMASALNEFLGL